METFVFNTILKVLTSAKEFTIKKCVNIRFNDLKAFYQIKLLSVTPTKNYTYYVTVKIS